MRKSVVGVFSHPDDEAFGPSGTLAKLAQENDLYIICATKGGAGENHLSTETAHITTLREKELLASAEIIGAKEVYFLDLQDGMICNNLYHSIADRVQTILEELKPHTIMTYEPRGISGHIDHMAMSMITTFVFEKLLFIKKLMYYCITEETRKSIENYFIYFPPGYKLSEIDEVVDVSDVWETKLRAVQVHKTQAKDMGRILKRLEAAPKKEYFLIKQK